MGTIEGLNGVDTALALKSFSATTSGERYIPLSLDFSFFNSLSFEVGVAFLIFGDFTDCVGGGSYFLFRSCLWEPSTLSTSSLCSETTGVKLAGIISETFGENETFFPFKLDLILMGLSVLFECNIGHVFIGEDCEVGTFLFLAFFGTLHLFSTLDVILGGELFDLADFDFDTVFFTGGDRFLLIFGCLREDVMGSGSSSSKSYRLLLLLEETLVVVSDPSGLVFSSSPS